MRVLLIAPLAWLLAVACSQEPPQPQVHPEKESAAPPQAANPASVNCLEAGGRLSIEKKPAGDEFGVCLFEDNRQCEEWALLRGECPAGGRRITGYATPAGRWCAITGGEYTGVVASDNSERGDCVLPGGQKCDAEAYWQGSCGR